MGEPTIYKPSIYKGNGIYKNGAGGGGGDVSPDIPEEYKDLYEQVKYINNKQSSFVIFNNISFSNLDIVKIQYAIVETLYQDGQIFLSRTALNLAGDYLIDIYLTPWDYPYDQVRYGMQNSDKNRTQNYSPKLPNGYIGEIIAKYPDVIDNGQIKVTLASGAQNRTAQSCCIYEASSNPKNRNKAIGIIEIIDHSTLSTKYKFIPCKNKNTNKFGWFEQTTRQWNGNYTGTDYLEEWNPE